MENDFAEEIEHLHQLRRNCKRRLKILELKEAMMGLSISPEITMEIEDIKNKLEEIDRKLLRTIKISKHSPKTDELDVGSNLRYSQINDLPSRWWESTVGLRAVFNIRYEDDPLLHGWSHYQISNNVNCMEILHDNVLGEKVIQKTGGFTNAVSYPTIGSWLKFKEPIYVLPIRPKENFHVYFNVFTGSSSSTYLIYTNSGIDNTNIYDEREVVIKSNALFNGDWHSLIFNISDDVKSLLDSHFVHLNWICLRGNLQISEMIAVADTKVLERAWQSIKSPYLVKPN